MNGVVSLLDAPHERQVRALWDELATELDLHGVDLTPIPHFSYHVARSYDAEALEHLLAAVAHTMEPFRVRTSGLGLFTGPVPVLYLPVVRSRELSALHSDLWHAITRLSDGAVPYYAPESWIPHITLAFGDLDERTLPRAIQRLCGRDLSWELLITDFAMIDGSAMPHTLRARFPFQGPF